ncbi:MAG TPA: KGG domain-containing protein [Dokdonella sp.]
MNEHTNGQSRGRGFASMDRAKQREIARLGGRAAHRRGTAHEFTPEEARAAGQKGGAAVSADRSHMAAIGRRGGEASRRYGSAKRGPDDAPAEGRDDGDAHAAPAGARTQDAEPAARRPAF